MGILTRFRDIMASNINALLDKAEDPEKMIAQYLRDANSDLGNVKAETASVMAEEARAKRELDECTEDIEKYQSYAVKAVEAGNDNDAKTFLVKKADLTEKLATLQRGYDLAVENTKKMRAMHDKLEADIKDLETRRDLIKGKMKVAKTQERINSLGSSMKGASKTMEAFERMEEKANRMYDTATAMAELDAPDENDAEVIAEKYKSSAVNVEDELAKIKADLGK